MEILLKCSFSIGQEKETLYILSPCCEARLDYKASAKKYECVGCSRLFPMLGVEDHPEAAAIDDFQASIDQGAYAAAFYSLSKPSVCESVTNADVAAWWIKKWTGQTVEVKVEF